MGDWLLINNELYIVIKEISEGNAFVYTGDNANVRRITVEEEHEAIYYPNDKRLSIHGKIDDYQSIVTSGDIHVYEPTISAIRIEHID